MENKQPEDDLFDRLNVSGQSALCWRRGPARASSQAPKGEVCRGWLGLHTLPPVGTQWIHAQSPETGGQTLPFILFWLLQSLLLAGCPATSAGDWRPFPDILSGKILIGKDNFALLACLRLKYFIGRYYANLCFGILFTLSLSFFFLTPHWQDHKLGKIEITLA